MKKVAYTICSANHLPFAKTMFNSFKEFNFGYELIVLLVDKINSRFNKESYVPITLIELNELHIEEISSMSTKYSIFELACALKPFMALHLIKLHNPDSLVYIDTDILFFDEISEVEQALLKSSIVLTPHIQSPYPNDTLKPIERYLLRSGMYNAGFFALKNNEETIEFLKWWSQHLINECFVNFEEGMFVDQVWLNFIPIFYKNAYVLNHSSYNVAYWNLHERFFSKINDRILINNSPLVFLHISGFNIETPEFLSKHQNRFDLNDFKVLAEILFNYRNLVLKNGYWEFKNLECAYAKKPIKSLGIIRTINKFLTIFGLKIQKNN